MARLVLAMFAFCGAVAIAVALYAINVGPRAEAAPIREPAIVSAPLPPLDAQQMVDLRVDAFRAGLTEGLSQGCGAAPLSYPVAQR